MKKEIELLAPGGDVDSIKAAILAGANAIYCGLDKFLINLMPEVRQKISRLKVYRAS